ncbi:2,4-dienoyl-CoA reductase [Pseudobutyrivibrio sp. NOR37]|uniref:NAD(P)-binding protein n=1 Tax=Pseudobutyrivibrio xylanivorans TaxID=185007 RepID=A0A6M0LKQ2_PSEXY|nr:MULTISPECIES: FAD-dependent oxidoreductase [Pseudobutyrivibrio]NEX02529.1 NAD(P)-binding protein [Pseudobutyrivibrio xylanivorans]SFR82627.1 2,4-dienoyl-CoA reductase [Pseudobutyrivibrio sp. NOR37]
MSKRFPGKDLYPNLFSSIRIGNLKLKNRIIAAPTSPSMITTEGLFTPEMAAYLEEKALGGCAVVTYGEAIPHSKTGKSHNKQLQLDAFGVRQGLTESSRMIHNAGGLANIQLSHGGMYGGLASVGGDIGKDGKAYGPSEMDMPAGHVYEMPKELIYEIIESYGKAAKLCKDVGYDMVQVHAAHGWLFNQFMSPLFNHRTDEFGGSLENRVRFLSLTLDEVRKNVGPTVAIELRMNGDDFQEGGLTLSDYVEIAKMVEDKVDMFNISCGNHEDPAMFCRTHPSSFFPRGVNVYLSAEIKKHVNKPVACVGSLNDPAQMEEIIATGQADMVEIGRALVADPYLPKKALEGRADDISPCLRCYECFGATGQLEMIKCTVNPTQGQQLEEKYGVPAPEFKKKILVVGGGPAGMEAAITAANRGHDVTLVEKENRLGGNLHPAGAAYFKEDIKKLCQCLERRVEKAGVKVILNTEVDQYYVEGFAPDALFVAIGSNELRPPIKGIDGDNVIMAIDAELQPEKLGKKVAIMGGGLVGAEAACSFAKEGHEVSIIEMKPDVAMEVNSFYRGGLMPHVQESAEIFVNTKVTEITEKGVMVENADGSFLVEADSVVCALGFRPKTKEVDELCEKVDEYYIIGDCNRVAMIYQAMDAGYHAARRV